MRTVTINPTRGDARSKRVIVPDRVEYYMGCNPTTITANLGMCRRVTYVNASWALQKHHKTSIKIIMNKDKKEEDNH